MTTQDRAVIWNLIRLPLLALLALTALLATTIAVAYVHLGAMNLVASLLIAAIKIAIIAVIFMELLKSTGIQRLAAGVGLFWLIFLFLLSFADYLSR